MTSPSNTPSRASLGPRRLAGFAVTLLLFGGAAWLCRYSLRDMQWARLWHDLDAMPRRAIVIAILLTAVSHLALTIYDYIGVRYIRSPLDFGRVALAAFLAYSISHSLGFAAVTGGAVRYRLYSRWGLGAVEVAQIMAMAGITMFLGMFLIGGAALLADIGGIEKWTQLPRAVTIILGAACIAIVAAYASLGFVRRRPISLFGFAIDIPRPSFAFVQIAVSGIDWLLVASVLFVLLPPTAHVAFPAFLAVFVLAYLLGILSNVPGGLGVFESIILITLTPAVRPEAVVSSLLVYRAVYHLLPLTIGGLGLLLVEFRGPPSHASRTRGVCVGRDPTVAQRRDCERSASMRAPTER